ncbi:ATP-binding protein [Patescibacteria group bacterium]|nr:ATP-binding protein [Patescibacteria group bacterium]
MNSMGHYIKRELEKKLVSWLPEREIIAICGPRQSGKTTLVKKIAEDLKLSGKEVFYASFEDTETLLSFIRAPKEFVSLHMGGGDRTFFIFDEYQLVPGGGKVLKLLFDLFEEAKFIITGSSSLKIRDLAENLVGRVIFFELYPLSFSEFLSCKDGVVYKKHESLQTAFTEFLFSGKFESQTLLYEDTSLKLFEEYAIYGGYPAVALSERQKSEERLQSFINTYVERDIVKLLKIGNYLDFRNFAQSLSLQIANLITYSSFGSELGLSFREVRKFLSALEETYVVKSLLPFSKNRATEIKKSRKVYFIDLGLRNGLIGDFRALEMRQDKGALAENFVLQNLIYRPSTSDVRYWRTKQGAEVDFVLKMQGELVPIEVKFQNMKKAEISKSLVSFINLYSVKRAVVLTKNFSGTRLFGNARVAFFPIYSV